MPLRASLPLASAAEAEAALEGLVRVNTHQLTQGYPPIASSLRSGRLRYIRRDPDEEWRSLAQIWRHGGGDCEDLAAAVAAELRALGYRARVVIRRARPGLLHALTLNESTGQLLDPSLTGGMGQV